MGGPARCGACRSPGRIPRGDATLAGQAGSRTGGPTCSRSQVPDHWLAASVEPTPRERTAQVRWHLLVRVDAVHPLLLVVLPVEEGDLVGPAVALLTSRELLDDDIAFHIHRELRLAAVIDDDIRPAAKVPAVESPIRDCVPAETACELHPIVTFISGPAGARRHSALLWIRVAPPDAGPVAAPAASPKGCENGRASRLPHIETCRPRGELRSGLCGEPLNLGQPLRRYLLLQALKERRRRVAGDRTQRYDVLGQAVGIERPRDLIRE